MISILTLQRDQSHPEVRVWRDTKRGFDQVTSDLSVKSSATCKNTEDEESVKVHMAYEVL